MLVFQRIAAVLVVLVATTTTVTAQKNSVSLVEGDDQNTKQTVHSENFLDAASEALVFQEKTNQLHWYSKRHLEKGNEGGGGDDGSEGGGDGGSDAVGDGEIGGGDGEIGGGDGEKGDGDDHDDNYAKADDDDADDTEDGQGKGEGGAPPTAEGEGDTEENEHGSEVVIPSDGVADEQKAEAGGEPNPSATSGETVEPPPTNSPTLANVEAVQQPVKPSESAPGDRGGATGVDGSSADPGPSSGVGGNDGKNSTGGGESTGGGNAASKEDAKAATKPPTPGLDLPGDEESHVGAIFGLLFFLGCGGAAWKNRHMIMDKLNMPTGMGGIPSAKTAKYHEVAVDEQDDEEWGWGEDDDGGDVELAGSSRDDSSVHKRRTSSNESLPNTPSKPSPTAYRKTSPRLNSQARGHMSMDSQPHIPRLIPKAPAPGPVVSHGMSLTKPSIPSSGGVRRANSGSRPGMSLSAPKTPALIASPPASAPILSTATAAPDFSNMQGLKITTLGPKRTPAAPAKAPAPAPSSAEDDIFASMGLSAKPTFSHAPPAPAKPVPSSSLGSRWGAAPATSMTAAAPVLASTSTFTSASNNFAASSDDDANWDDDGDLDDLFDD